MERNEGAVGFTAMTCVFFVLEITRIVSPKNHREIVGTIENQIRMVVVFLSFFPY